MIYDQLVFGGFGANLVDFEIWSKLVDFELGKFGSILVKIGGFQNLVKIGGFWIRKILMNFGQNWWILKIG